MDLIGVDIGGSSVKSGLVRDGRIIKTSQASTSGCRSEETFIGKVMDSINKVFVQGVSGIGAGCPSPLDHSSGVILNPPNIPLKNTPLRKILEEEFKVPVSIDNDANCFVLGEAVFGKARKNRIVTGFTLGTGLGGGVVINKEIFRGNGNAAEFWFSTINFDGLEGKIANQGAAEEYLSARGLMRMVSGLGAGSPEEVFDLAEKGERQARQALSEFGRYVGIFSINLISAFDPDAIVIGGKIARAGRYFRESMNMELKKAPFNNATIHFITDPERSAILGAASLLNQGVESSE